jgi:hypothetical protein
MKVKAEMQLRKLTDSDQKLGTILSDMPADPGHTIKRGQHTRAWLYTLPSTINGTELYTQECRDALSI